MLVVAHLVEANSTLSQSMKNNNKLLYLIQQRGKLRIQLRPMVSIKKLQNLHWKSQFSTLLKLSHQLTLTLHTLNFLET